MENVLYAGLQFAVCLTAFILGKYLLAGSNADKLKYISQWAYKFVLAAKVMLSDSSGAEKNACVASWINEVCKKQGIKLTKAQISALIEEAYFSMKGGGGHQD